MSKEQDMIVGQEEKSTQADRYQLTSKNPTSPHPSRGLVELHYARAVTNRLTFVTS